MSELVYLIRHPKTDLSSMNIIQGQDDSKLIPGYEGKLLPLAEHLRNKNIEVIFASDLERSYVPAKKIVELLREKPYSPNLDFVSTPRLRERHWGDMQGEAHCGDPKFLNHIFSQEAVPGENGEDLEMIEKRVKSFLRDDLSKYRGNAVVFGHLFFMNYLRNYIKNGGILKGGYRQIKSLSYLDLSDKAHF